MKILIVSDAWGEQVNGVVTTLRQTMIELQRLGHEVEIIGPQDFFSLPMPFYREIRVPITTRGLSRRIEQFKPDAIHIAVEGRLGLATRRYCLRRGIPFTTAYHTDFPKYLKAHFGISPRVTWRFIRWFHGRSSAVLASTSAIQDELTHHGIAHVVEWTRGVSREFTYQEDRTPNDVCRLLYVGRVSREKNIEAFLNLKLDFPHEKHVVGDGPCLERLRAIAGPEVIFHGKQRGVALADHYRSADVFVFPSRSDTFGLVMIEAMACGTPIAAYPVQGPIDVVGEGGSLNADLALAVIEARKVSTQNVLRAARPYTWESATQQFVAALRPIHI